MSDSDIEKAVKEAAEFEAQDKKRKEGIDAKNDADAMVFQTEKAMEEVGDKIDPADKATVEADCKALKELLEKVNMDDISEAQVAEINAGKEKLMESAQKLFAKVYEQAQGAQGAQGAGPNPGAGPAPEGFDGDDVVDGDYKEV
jgi:molecular chaperone DnaK